MATTAGNAAIAIGDVTRYTEMRHRLFFLRFAVVIAAAVFVVQRFQCVIVLAPQQFFAKFTNQVTQFFLLVGGELVAGELLVKLAGEGA